MAMELCLFDLDGTLLDTQADYLATDRYMRSVYNLEPLPLEVSMRLASAGLRAVIDLECRPHTVGPHGIKPVMQHVISHFGQCFNLGTLRGLPVDLIPVG